MKVKGKWNYLYRAIHDPIKKLIVAAGGFKLRKRAWSTIQGFESLRMLNKGQFDFWLRNDKRKTVVRERAAFMNRFFNVEVVFNNNESIVGLIYQLRLFATIPVVPLDNKNNFNKLNPKIKQT